MSTRAELKATQLVYPWKAAIRTAVQVGIPTLVTLGVVVPAVIQVVLDELGERMPDALRVWLLAAVGTITAVSLALARIMAIPAVNVWLTRLGLGATPRVIDATDDGVPVITSLDDPEGGAE